MYILFSTTNVYKNVTIVRTNPHYCMYDICHPHRKHVYCYKREGSQMSSLILTTFVLYRMPEQERLDRIGNYMNTCMYKYCSYCILYSAHKVFLNTADWSSTICCRFRYGVWLSSTKVGSINDDIGFFDFPQIDEWAGSFANVGTSRGILAIMVQIYKYNSFAHA